MGGMGSGNYLRSGKQTTSSYLRLDVRDMQRKRLLQPGTGFSRSWTCGGRRVASIEVCVQAHCVRLIYCHSRIGGEWVNEDYTVVLDWSRCHYGGKRAWFRCPGRNCGRRVAVLYGDGLFLCRRCHSLNYESQHKHAWERALCRYRDIREKLGAAPGIGPLPGKPKGMHWRTYDRLCREAGQVGAGTWPRWIRKLSGQ